MIQILLFRYSFRIVPLRGGITKDLTRTVGTVVKGSAKVENDDVAYQVKIGNFPCSNIITELLNEGCSVGFSTCTISKISEFEKKDNINYPAITDSSLKLKSVICYAGEGELR